MLSNSAAGPALPGMLGLHDDLRGRARKPDPSLPGGKATEITIKAKWKGEGTEE